jgi:hypothetical protein
MDNYDKAIQHLTNHPEEMFDAWFGCSTHRAGCLFQYATPTGKFEGYHANGCLTQIKNNPAFGSQLSPELLERIKLDDRIPNSPEGLKAERLEAFAELQRELDETIRK